MVPTAAQVHVSLLVLRHFPNWEGAMMTNAQKNVRYAVEVPGWTGATETCPPFGFQPDPGQEVEKLTFVLSKYSSVINTLIAGLRDVKVQAAGDVPRFEIENKVNELMRTSETILGSILDA